MLIETGRHSGIARENRTCGFCNTNDIEDEYHFVLICPLYKDIRSSFIKRYFKNHPSVFILIELLNSNGKNLALYIIKAFERRNETVNNIVN